MPNFNPEGINFIAEVSCNHGGDLYSRLEHIRVAHECGATAVKFQLYEADDMVVKDDPNSIIPWPKSGKWLSTNLWDLYDKVKTPYSWLPEIMAYAEARNINVFCSVFSPRGVAAIGEYKSIKTVKIASAEINYVPLLKEINNYYSLPNAHIFISTGCANLKLLDEAIGNLQPKLFTRRYADDDLRAAEKLLPTIIPLYCVAQYPTDFSEVNLRAFSQWQKVTGGRIWGVSDHSKGYVVPIMSVALGARYIEKHFILDKNMPSVDAPWSMEPHEFEHMIKQCTDAFSAMGYEKPINLNNIPKHEVERKLIGDKYVRVIV